MPSPSLQVEESLHDALCRLGMNHRMVAASFAKKSPRNSAKVKENAIHATVKS